MMKNTSRALLMMPAIIRSTPLTVVMATMETRKGRRNCRAAGERADRRHRIRYRHRASRTEDTKANTTWRNAWRGTESGR
ncbi:MAG: hypothetical protein HFG73_04340 [Hungatella sp.]|nr:hypothetical protein [Hungatella sp.]